MRKLTAFVLIFMLVLSTVAVGYAAPKGTPPGQLKKMAMFDDTEGHWAESIINDLADQGLVKGYGNGKFMPNKAVTKLESLVMLYEVVEGYGEDWPEADDFDPDIHGLYKGPEWGQAFYAWAWEKGAFGDSTKLFNANAAITRAEFAFYAANLILDKDDFYWEDYESYAKGYDDDEDIDEEYAEGVGFMNRFRLMIGDEMNMFHGGGALKRAEAAMVMYRYMHTDWTKSEYPSAKVYLNGETARDNVAVKDLEIKVVFSEDVFDEDGDGFDEDSILEIVTLLDSDEKAMDLEVDDYDGDWWILVLKDGEDLEKNATYVFEIEDDSVYDEDENELRGQTSVEFTTMDERLRAWLDPEDGTTGVALGDEIAIEFSEEPFMEDDGNYVAYTETEAEGMITITFENFEEVDGEVDEFDIDLDGDRWILDFDKEYNTTYKIKLDSSHPEDYFFTEEGEEFTGDHVFTFSTIGNYELEFTVETLMDGEPEWVDATQPTVVTIDFGKDILNADEDPFDEDDLDELVRILPDEFDLAAILEWEFDGDDTVILTVDHLDFDTEYTVTVDEDMLFGGIEGDNSVTFETREEPEISGEYTSPSTVEFTFDGPIVDEEGDSLDESDYTVLVYEEDVDGDLVSGFEAELENGVLTLTFGAEALENGEDYVVVLEGFYYNGGEAYGEYDEADPFEFTAEMEETE